MRKALLWGFIFGTAGMYALAMLSLVSPIFENIGSVLFAPGRYLAERFAGVDGSTNEVLLLTIANGIFYATIFWLASKLMD